MEPATILAAIAIGISLLTLGWTIFWSIYTHRRTTEARLTVTSSFSIPVYDEHLGNAAIDITATNTGAVTITVTGAQLRIKGKKQTLAPFEWVVQTPSSLPLVLEPGKHWSGLVDASSIVASLDERYGPREKWTLRAFVRDPASRTYEASKWTTIDVGAVKVLDRA